MKEKQPKILRDRIAHYGFVAWKELKPLQTDDFKTYEPAQIQKLKNSIIKNGFMTPLFVWQNKTDAILLDGFHRIIAFKELESIDGVNVPPEVPALFIDCKDRKDAKKTLLLLNSRYAKIQDAALWDFVSDLNLDELKTEIDIPGMSFEMPGNVDFDNIESNENREKKFKDHLLTCPHCKASFTVKI